MHFITAPIIRFTGSVFIKKVCQCRKPGTGMFLQAEERFRIDKAHSYMIGDKLLDVGSGSELWGSRDFGGNRVWSGHKPGNKRKGGETLI